MVIPEVRPSEMADRAYWNTWSAAMVPTEKTMTGATRMCAFSTHGSNGWLITAHSFIGSRKLRNQK